jgi:hypothetical protein
MTLPWIAGSAAVGVATGQMAGRRQVTHLARPGFRPSVGRSSGAAGGP